MAKRISWWPTVASVCGWATGTGPSGRRSTPPAAPALALATGDFNGDGSFQAAVNYAAGSGPRALAVADCNGDGAADLVVANALDGTVSVLLGNGDGTFQATVNYPAGAGPAAWRRAILGGHGKADLAVANALDGTVSVLLGNATAPSSRPRATPWGPIRRRFPSAT